jgi:ribosomal protein S18 acetylase RimI-like enzyme
MNIELERIQSADHKYIPDLLNLYLDAFPREERRELNVLVAMLDENEMYFAAIMHGSVPVGLVIYWIFDGFLYVEHLAVRHEHRGKGIGGAILKMLREKGDPVMLEVEIPHDEASLQRVHFYNRSGFNQLPVEYFQPPYREGESVLPMMLYSDSPVWDEEVLRRTIELFQTRVYYSRH